MTETLDSFKNPRTWNSKFNITHYIISANNLLLVNPRNIARLIDTFHLKDVFGIFTGHNIISEEASRSSPPAVVETRQAFHLFMSKTSGKLPNSKTQKQAQKQIIGGFSRFMMEGIRGVLDIFSYATSKWALACLITAVVLNRTNFYARTRWSLNLSWKARLILRIIPILLLAMQCRNLLKSIHCQTYNQSENIQQGNNSIENDRVIMQAGEFLYGMSKILFFGSSEKDSCMKMGILPSDADTKISKSLLNKKGIPVVTTGSLSLLWPLFKTFALSQFVETLSCAILGRRQAWEFGMSLLQLSLAFVEAEAMAISKLDNGGFRTNKRKTIKNKPNSSKPNVLNNVNTSPEVLIVALISAMDHLSSHILAIFNQQAEFRLLNTGIWGLAYISLIVERILSIFLYDEPEHSLLRFPTVCIISFIPHFLILLGIMGCSLIYVIALLLTAMSPPVAEEHDDNRYNSNWPVIQRLLQAHRNMQANHSFSRIDINLQMDFFSALIRTGVSIMSMANEAIYLNESRGVFVNPQTWIEEDRLQELEATGLQLPGLRLEPCYIDSRIGNGLFNDVGLVPTAKQPIDMSRRSTNGFAREMIGQTSDTRDRQRSGPVGNGVGASERSGRWYIAFEFCLGFIRLLLGCYGSFHLWLIARLGIQSQPRWLLWMSRLPNKMPQNTGQQSNLNIDSLNPDPLYRQGELGLSKDWNVDIETEFRKKAHRGRKTWTDADEKKLDASLYKWWLDGGWWGDKDNSGNFVPSQQEQDEDTTSIFSFSTTSEDHSWESDSADENRNLTPTQGSPLISRESTPSHDTTLTLTDLAQLLNPNIPEKRAEAENLAAHLANDQIITRSRFLKIQQRSRAKVLTSTLQRPSNFTCSSSDGKLTPEEECRILEHLIIDRRNRNNSNFQQGRPAAWVRNTDESGPQCVVCQTSPRCIIVWPCRCLSLCNECRITLAMNNFEKCVCCRGDVVSFSRIFVP